MIKWVLEMVEKMTISEATEFMGKVEMTAWYIRRERKDFIFRKLKIDPLKTMAVINHARLECSNIIEIPKVHMGNPSIQEGSTNWRALDEENFKVNCDVVLPANRRKGKMAVIFKELEIKGKCWMALQRESVGRLCKIC